MPAPHRVTRTEIAASAAPRKAVPATRDAATLARWEQWREENREPIKAYNAYVEREGIPLAEFRKF